MKALITGFDPFGGETINPAYEAVKLLENEIEGCTIIKKEIPTVFGKSIEILLLFFYTLGAMLHAFFFSKGK